MTHECYETHGFSQKSHVTSKSKVLVHTYGHCGISETLNTIKVKVLSLQVSGRALARPLSTVVSQKQEVSPNKILES